MGFYGHLDTSKRQETWALLRHLATLSPEPSLCMGDFNEILEHGDKWGGARRARTLIDNFKGALEDCSLSDLGASGPRFTWNNGRHGRDFTKEKLDWAVANKRWCDFFPLAEVSILANRASDHNPLHITLKSSKRNARQTKRPFRFESQWARMDDFKEVVKQGWRVKEQNSNPWFAVKKNMRNCREVIMKWVRKKTKGTEDLI
jgi:hypothetical protein